MSKTMVLDCTLRDGGYCNQWEFGFDKIRKIVKSLVDSNVDIIECGFLTNKVQYDKDVSKFTNLDELASVIPVDRKNKLFVAMMNYGEYDLSVLPEYDGTSIDGIRVAFHKKNLDEAIATCKAIQEKGYKVFVQAMVSLSYTDEEFLSLINKVNEINPHAFYIVDSFGMMKKKNLIRLFYIVENNLSDSVIIGFHSHNNMQLAYSNAQNLIETQTSRNLILDSSIYGMGRGAGNLNTELLVDYLNETLGNNYDVKPLLSIIDEVLNDCYQHNYWGYSLPNYLSASHWTHPNYASYLSEKNTLTVEAMDEIFSMMSDDKRFEYDKSYIEDLYLKYMESGKVQEDRIVTFKEVLKGKTVLLIAPGKSSVEEQDKVVEFADDCDVVPVSVNFDYEPIKNGYIFASNLRRFRELDNEKAARCIITSNIVSTGVYLKVSYYELLNSTNAVEDNAGLMAMKMFVLLGVTKFYLAGFDGYSYDSNQNYANQEMAWFMKNARIDALNQGMIKEIREIRKVAKIKFLTEEKYIR